MLSHTDMGDRAHWLPLCRCERRTLGLASPATQGPPDAPGTPFLPPRYRQLPASPQGGADVLFTIRRHRAPGASESGSVFRTFPRDGSTGSPSPSPGLGVYKPEVRQDLVPRPRRGLARGGRSGGLGVNGDIGGGCEPPGGCSRAPSDRPADLEGAPPA